MAVEDKYIRASAVNPEINEKININVSDPNNPIYWYIAFNNDLDETSINSESMYVIDRDGYVLETKINYLHSSGLIQILPIDRYIQGRYYILCITKKVRSANMNNLDKCVHILFKIKEDQIVKFQVLPDNVSVPEPIRSSTKSKVYTFQKNGYKIEQSLKTADIKVNPLLGAAGVLLTIISIFLRNQIFTAISGTIAVFGIVHIIMQFSKKELQSNIIYNFGVSSFNKGNSAKADRLFKKALEINPDNELAEYALNKLSYYE